MNFATRGRFDTTRKMGGEARTPDVQVISSPMVVQLPDTSRPARFETLPSARSSSRPIAAKRHHIGPGLAVTSNRSRRPALTSIPTSPGGHFPSGSTSPMTWTTSE